MFWAVMVGPVAGLLVGMASEYYTSDEQKPVHNLAASAETGAATIVIDGVAIGLKSTVLPILITSAAVLISYHFGGFYGLALSAVSMLSISGITIAVDAYGPVADNAGGIAEMAGLPEEVRDVTDALDSVGNSMATVTKGFDISAATLTALALFAAYTSAAKLERTIYSPHVIMASLSAVFYLSSCRKLLDAVGRAAGHMIEEVRRQFREIPGLREGKAKPDYERCVDISPAWPIKKWSSPAWLRYLPRSSLDHPWGRKPWPSISRFLVADADSLPFEFRRCLGYAKKYIEAGALAEKVRSPWRGGHQRYRRRSFKDTAGPSLNILFKLIEIVALAIAPILIR